MAHVRRNKQYRRALSGGAYAVARIENRSSHDIVGMYVRPNNTLAYRIEQGGHTLTYGERNGTGGPIDHIALDPIQPKRSLTIWFSLSSVLARSQIEAFEFIVPRGVTIDVQIH